MGANELTNDPPGQNQFFSDSSQGLDTRRIENHLFATTVQVCEQVVEHKKIGLNLGLRRFHSLISKRTICGGIYWLVMKGLIL
jgi:hypothetical protein